MNRSSNPRRPKNHRDEAGETASKPKKAAKRRPQKLRIIGGSMRGRTVVYHGEEVTRPMKDSVRESLFNIIGPRVKGTQVIDLFTGTGAVAFESLSRGASSAIAIEKDRRAHSYLVATAESLDVTARIKILFGDAFRLGCGLLGPAAPDAPLIDTPRIVFFCPPYALWDSAAESLERLFRLAMDHSPPGSLIVAESDKHLDASQLPSAAWDHRMYGGTRLSFVQPEFTCGMTSL